MSVETFDINDNKQTLLSISDAAEKHFLKQLTKTESVGIRLTLKQAGCTGYKYVIDEIEAVIDSDVDIELKNGVHLYVDSRYLGAIRGTEIDIKKQGLNTNLIMENPNVKDECGCGESFSVESFEQEQ